MKKEETITVILNTLHGLVRKEDFFKTPEQVIEDALEAYARHYHSEKMKQRDALDRMVKESEDLGLYDDPSTDHN